MGFVGQPTEMKIMLHAGAAARLIMASQVEGIKRIPGTSFVVDGFRCAAQQHDGQSP